MANNGRISNSERQDKIIKITEEYIKYKKKVKEDLTEKYFTKLKKLIPEVIKSSIDSYYEYNTKYDRKKSLYEACECYFNRQNESFELIFDSKNIELMHPGKGEYIYKWMFGGDIEDPESEMGGWHGGDTKGEGHPNPGTPWLRKGIKIGQKGKGYFVKGNHWLREASRTESPYILIINNVQDEIDLQGELMQEEYNELVVPKFKEIEKQVRIYIYGGDK